MKLGIMIRNAHIQRNYMAGRIAYAIILLLLIRLCISCTRNSKELNDQITCDVFYLESEVSEDSLNPGYINDNYNHLDWGILSEPKYCKLNRKNEIWYNIHLPDSIPENSVIVIPAYSHGFDVYSGAQIIYNSDHESRSSYFRIHIIPLINREEPVFIRFRYRNFNNAIIRYPVFVVPEGNITEYVSADKFNYFDRDFGLVFPGTALCVLGLVSVLLFLRRRFKEYNTFLYFGLFSLITGILYILPVARLSPINLSPDWYFAIEHFVVHLLLIFFVLLNISIFNAGKSIMLKILIVLFGLLALLDFPIFLLYPMPFESNIILGVLVSAFIVTSIILGYSDTRKSEGIKRFMYYMLILTYLLAIGDVIISLVLPESNIVLFGIGIIVYVLSVIYYLEDQYYVNLGRSQQFFTELEFRKNEILRLEQQNLKSQLSALKSQINPHFLFNSLNVLTSIIRKDPELSEKYVEQLSKIYRYILEFKSEDLVPFQTEMEFIRAYLFLMNLRFGEKLIFEISNDLNLVTARIPHLSLQMLIENAVKHNTFSAKSPLKISISLVDQSIVVSNNSQPRTTKEISTGIGIKNIEERYRLITDRVPYFGLVKNEFVAKIPLID